MKYIEKSFYIIDKVLDNIVNGINVNENLKRYYDISYHIQRYIQYNLMLCRKELLDENSLNIPIYLKSFYIHLYTEANYYKSMFKPNLNRTLEENAKYYFGKDYDKFKKI